MIEILAATIIAGLATIIDGDTIEVQNTRIRLWGIDAPEMDTREGRAAKTFLKATLRDETVLCFDLGQRTYNRVVAQCYIGKCDIADLLVHENHARDWPRYSRGYYSKRSKDMAKRKGCRKKPRK